MSLQTVCPKVKFRPPFQRRWNPKVKPLVAPRTERNSFPSQKRRRGQKYSGGMILRGEPSPGVPLRVPTRGESRLLLGNKNSLVLPTSAWIKSCRGGSLCPPVFCAAGHTEFEQAVGACLFFHIPVSALAKSCGRRWNAAPTL